MIIELDAKKIVKPEVGDVVVTDDETYILSKVFINGTYKYGVIRQEDTRFVILEDSSSADDLVKDIRDNWGEEILEVIPAHEVKLVRA